MTAQPMNPDDVPSDLVDDAVDAWHDAPRDEHGNRPMLDDLMRHILAAVIPAIRAQVADEIEANPMNECSGAVAECARIARGGQ